MNSIPNNNSGLNRRRFIKAAGFSIPLITVGGQSGWTAERITLKHPSAGPLGYVHDPATVDTTKFPVYENRTRLGDLHYIPCLSGRRPRLVQCLA